MIWWKAQERFEWMALAAFCFFGLYIDFRYFDPGPLVGMILGVGVGAVGNVVITPWLIRLTMRDR